MMSPLSTFVDTDDYLDFLDKNLHSEYYNLDDCFLSEDAFESFLAPPQETWRDFPSGENEAKITLDSAKELQWKLAKDEISHIRNRMTALCSSKDPSSITLEDIMKLIIGPESKIGRFLQEELDLDEVTYLKFLSTLCVQAAYHTSSTQLFFSKSLLRDHTRMSKKEYNEIWKRMSEKKKIPPSQISTNRRDTPLWEKLETIVNELLRSVSITEREGRVSVALDDDKIWMILSNSAMQDLFNLKYTTHVKANRKGIIAHTAVSTALNIPLGIVFEKTKDTTAQCFKRVLDFLFDEGGNTNLRNVSLHSDRGYMVPNVVFEYLIASGAEVVGTVKRMAQCWPFTYDQKLKSSDKRTLIDTKGAPTLFLKWCKSGAKYLFASAFRNGSGSVATAISTMHNQHQWEGIALDKNELDSYRRDKSSLHNKFFSKVECLLNGNEESEEECEAIHQLLNEKIDPMTLRQGESDFINFFIYDNK